MKFGLLVNPIAGIGGPAGFKGSDDHWQEALANGETAGAIVRAAQLVAAVDCEWITVSGCMGGDAAPGAETLQLPVPPLGQTTRAHTIAAAKGLVEVCDVLVFVGGDGTATDVSSAIGDGHPCLGVPGGVKITSPVFTHDVQEAAWLLNHLSPGFPTTIRDVTDLDEEAYRVGRLSTRLTGSLQVPISPVMQDSKNPTSVETPLEPIVEQAMADWHDGLWIVGAGSVCHAVKKQFWGEGTLLGVDVIIGNNIAHADCNASQLLQIVSEWVGPVHLLLSPIGGQGMLLGRGTQVLHPTLLHMIGWPNIHIIAPPEKLLGVRGLHIDSGDATFDGLAPTYARVTSGWHETRMVRLLHGPPTTP